LSPAEAEIAGMPGPVAKSLIFADFTVDFGAGRIVGKSGSIDVEPQVFDVIALLASNPGRLVGHDEIIEKVWRGRIISDSAIASRIAAARKALGDDGTTQRVIKTIRGRGFRFELEPINSIKNETAPAAIDGPTGAPGGFVLSCAPHAYALIMKAHTQPEAREHWRQALPAMFEAVVHHCGGRIEAPSLGIFDSGTDALNCARAIIEAVEGNCRKLPATERWNVKIGIACGTLSHGFAHALAGRMDALAHPGGVCITRRVKEASSALLETVVITESEEQDGSFPLRVLRIGDRILAKQRKVQHAQLLDMDIPLSSEPSIIVRPFEALGKDDEIHDVAVGLRLEIHNVFARLSGVISMAAATQAAYAGVPPADAAEALGVRFVLDGNVRGIGRAVRVMVELYDHVRGGVSWSHSFDGSLDEGFAFQDKITQRIVRELDVNVLSGEQARIWHKKIGSLRGIQLQYRGMRDFFSMVRERNHTAILTFEKLFELHPDVSLGANWLALCHWFKLQRGWADEPARTVQDVKLWAGIAGKMEDCDGQAHTAVCHVHLLDREFDLAVEAGERAVSIRPTCAVANGFYAHTLYYCGLMDKAIHHIRLAMRYTPSFPSLFLTVAAGALHARADHEAAIAIAKDAIRLNQQDGHARAILCSALMCADREREAVDTAVALKRMEPDFLPIPYLNSLPFRDEEMRRQLTINCSRAILNAE
jgi:DNA-binding winged helix-turn-helix (wHTH) protein/TolB-like protein